MNRQIYNIYISGPATCTIQVEATLILSIKDYQDHISRIYLNI